MGSVLASSKILATVYACLFVKSSANQDLVAHPARLGEIGRAIFSGFRW